MLASKEAAASTVTGPSGGAGSKLLLVLDRALTDEEQDCRERAQVPHKGMEADILLLSPPPRRRLSPSSSDPSTSYCCLHPVQSSSGHRISSLPLRQLVEYASSKAEVCEFYASMLKVETEAVTVKNIFLSD